MRKNWKKTALAMVFIFLNCIRASDPNATFLTAAVLLTEPIKLSYENPENWNGCNARVQQGNQFYGTICIIDEYKSCDSSTFNDVATETKRLDYIYNLDLLELSNPECLAPINKLRNIYLSNIASFSFLANHLFGRTDLKIVATSFYSSCKNLPWLESLTATTSSLLSKSNRESLNQWKVQLAITEGISLTCRNNLGLTATQIDLVTSINSKNSFIGLKCLYNSSLDKLNCNE
jgi:hypothetical protein